MKNDDNLGYSRDNKVCSDHFVCGKLCPLNKTKKSYWVHSLSLGHNDRKLIGNTSRYDTRASAKAATSKKVCELLGNNQDRNDNEEENVQTEAVQSGDD